MERCAVLQATRSVLTQSPHPSRASLARSNHFSQKDTGGPSCTLCTTLTPMRMEAELIAFLWQQPRPKIPAVSEFRTSRPSSRNASVVRDAFMPLPDSIHCQAQTPTGSLPDIYSVAHSSFHPSLIPAKVGCFPAVVFIFSGAVLFLLHPSSFNETLDPPLYFYRRSWWWCRPNIF